MAGYKHLLIAAAVVLVVAGCRAKPDESVALDTAELGWLEKGTIGPVSAFNEGLRTGYLGLASYEFVQKSRRAAQGHMVGPDHPDSRRLPPDAVVPVEAGHERMVRTLYLGAADVAPEAAARMQVQFDCWIDGLERDGAYSSFAVCGDGFRAALAEVEAACQAALDKKCAAAEPVMAMETPAPAPMTVTETPAPEPEPQPPAPRSFIVFFDWDRSDLTNEALGILSTAADYVASRGISRVETTGHADRSGSDAYNMGLSRRRVDAVAAELARLGVARDGIATAWRGEREPLVETPDGVREPQNRRVEIVFP